MSTYKGWELYDEMPKGWRIDKTCGSPLTGYDFINNGKSILFGGKRALLRVRKQQHQISFDDKHASKAYAPEDDKKPDVVIDAHYVRTVNELARQRFKQRLLNDILVDLMICEIEGWGKMEYINELRKLVNEIGSEVLIDV